MLTRHDLLIGYFCGLDSEFITVLWRYEKALTNFYYLEKANLIIPCDVSGILDTFITESGLDLERSDNLQTYIIEFFKLSGYTLTVSSPNDWGNVSLISIRP